MNMKNESSNQTFVNSSIGSVIGVSVGRPVFLFRLLCIVDLLVDVVGKCNFFISMGMVYHI